MKLNGAKIVNYRSLCYKNEEENRENSFRIRIPFYQRPYLWGSSEVKLLIDDFFKSYENSENKKYFAGAVVTVFDLQNKNEEFHELVDGQQRLTTVFLTNYLKFIILRKLTCLIIRSNNIKYFHSCKENLKSTYKNLFIDDHNFTAEMQDLLEPYMDLIDAKSSSKDLSGDFKKLENDYIKSTKVVVKGIDSEDYINNCVINNRIFLNERSLSLQYSRQSYNKNLKEILCKFDIKLGAEFNPEIVFSDDIKMNKIEELHPYINAIKEIFDNRNINSKNNNSDSIERTFQIINNIDTFLDDLDFCVVQTNNSSDAFTLFEVLNDRGIALTPLDLIKNKYYKVFCDNNPNLTDKKIDEKISILEKIWGDMTFNNDIANYKKNLIIYFGTVFLTGNTNLLYKDNKNFINPLIDSLKNNTYEEILYNFIVFNICKLIIEEFDIVYSNKNNKVFDSEASQNVSVIIKTIHLTNALGQVGIMSSLITVILNEYKKTIDNFSLDSFEKDFKDYIRMLKESYVEKKERFKNVYEVASNLRRLVLLSDGYKIPKKYSDKIIEVYNKTKVNLTDLDIPSRINDESTDSFIDWIMKWEKGIKNQDLKIKTLFLNLLLLHLEDDKLVRKTIPAITINKAGNIELDHFEPSDISKQNNKENYFIVNGERREQYVDQLGNFMLLEKKENIKKSNKPAREAHVYYKEMGIDKHWLTRELFSIFDKEKTVDEVPTKNFFLQRKKILVNYFFTLLNIKSLDLKSEIKVVKSNESSL